MRPVVPARRSRDATSAMKTATMAKVIGSDADFASAAMLIPTSAKTVKGVEAKVIIASFSAAPRTGIAAIGRANGRDSALKLRIQPRLHLAPAARRRAGSKR